MQGGCAAFLYVLMNVRVSLLLALMTVFLHFDPFATPHPLNPSCPEGDAFIL